MDQSQSSPPAPSKLLSAQKGRLILLGIVLNYLYLLLIRPLLSLIFIVANSGNIIAALTMLIFINVPILHTFLGFIVSLPILTKYYLRNVSKNRIIEIFIFNSIIILSVSVFTELPFRIYRLYQTKLEKNMSIGAVRIQKAELMADDNSQNGLCTNFRVKVDLFNKMVGYYDIQGEIKPINDGLLTSPPDKNYQSSIYLDANKHSLVFYGIPTAFKYLEPTYKPDSFTITVRRISKPHNPIFDLIISSSNIGSLFERPYEEITNVCENCEQLYPLNIPYCTGYESEADDKIKQSIQKISDNVTLKTGGGFTTEFNSELNYTVKYPERFKRGPTISIPNEKDWPVEGWYTEYTGTPSGVLSSFRINVIKRKIWEDEFNTINNIYQYAYPDWFKTKEISEMKENADRETLGHYYWDTFITTNNKVTEPGKSISENNIDKHYIYRISTFGNSRIYYLTFSASPNDWNSGEYQNVFIPIVVSFDKVYYEHTL